MDKVEQAARRAALISIKSVFAYLETLGKGRPIDLAQVVIGISGDPCPSQRPFVMNDTDCTAFLQWALPQLELRWPGYRKVRRQVCKRLRKRMAELGIDGFAGYRSRLSSARNAAVTSFPPSAAAVFAAA